MNYLFVCAGNTCRSPMAAALMQKALLDAGIKNFAVSSAGISAVPGASANSRAKKAVERYSADLSFHSARMFTRELARGRRVLCMDGYVKRTAELIAPDAEIFAICDYASVAGDIPDPYMMGQAEYDACADKLYECVKKIIARDGGES